MRPIPELKNLLNELIILIEGNKINTIIDRKYPFVDVASAHAYVDKGHKKGNVVLTI